MKLTNKEALDAAVGLRELVGFFMQAGDLKMAVKFGYTARYMDPLRQEILDAKNFLVGKHVAEGQRSIERDSPAYAGFMREWKEYLNCEVEVDLEKISLPKDVVLRIDKDIFILLLPIMDIGEQDGNG